LDRCLDIIKSLDTFTISHISREENFRANHLAQQASGYQVTSGKFLIMEKPMLTIIKSKTDLQVASSVLGKIESSGAEQISSFGVQGASGASLVQQQPVQGKEDSVQGSQITESANELEPSD